MAVLEFSVTRITEKKKKEQKNYNNNLPSNFW